MAKSSMKLSLICIWISLCYFNFVRCYQVGAEKICNPYFADSPIVGEVSASSGQWPWQAAVCIKSSDDSSWEFQCDGALISPRWVVSAAHCFYELNNPNILVLFGVDEVGSSSSKKQVKHVNKHIDHPGYDPITFFADISLLELKTDVKYSKHVQPAILPNSTIHFKHGHPCVVSGYGYTNGTGMQTALNYAEIEIISHHKCKSRYSESNISVPDDHVCAGLHEGDSGTCFGDGGGPLVCKKLHSNSTDYFLVGVTSYGTKCAERHRPGVYTNVATYLKWIMQNNGTAPALSPWHTTNGSSGIAVAPNAPTRCPSQDNTPRS